MAGCLSALVLMLAVSAAGLGVFLAAWPAMFNALRMIGAAYLVYLGIKAWRAPADEAAADHADELAAKPARSRFALFRNGVLVAGSNPKAILFAAALLPQFIDALSGSVLVQSLVLGSIQIVISVSVNAMIALAAGSIARFLGTRPSWLLVQRWLMGTVIAGLAVRMATEARR